MTAIYTSPLRPLDIGYASRLAGVAIDWAHTDIGPVDPAQLHTRRYAFVAALPAEIAAQLELRRVEEEEDMETLDERTQDALEARLSAALRALDAAEAAASAACAERDMAEKAYYQLQTAMQHMEAAGLLRVGLVKSAVGAVRGIVASGT